MRLTTEKTNYLFPPIAKQSFAEVILFAKSEVQEQLFPMAYVSCARFVEIDKANFLNRLDIF